EISTAPRDRELARRITGVVRSPAGDPIGGARVVTFSDNFREALSLASPDPSMRLTLSQADGSFALEPSDDWYRFTLYVEARGFSPASRSSVEPDDHVAITLDPAGSLSGTVRDLGGHPVAGAHVRWLVLLDFVRIEREAISAAD